MYDLISVAAQGEIDKVTFVDRYEAIVEEATITGIDYEMGTLVSADGDEMPVTITISTSFFGDIVQENTIPLVKDTVTLATSPGDSPESREEWRVSWSPSLIFGELDDRSLVHFFPRVPRRGSIFDRNGVELALDGEVSAIGIVPDLITDPEATISVLTTILGLPESEVRALVETDLPSYYFVPVMTLPFGTPQEEVQKLRDLVDLGVLVQENTLRIYPQGSLAAHLLGYVAEVTADQLEELSARGYEAGDLIGAFGLERQSDALLAGERGATLATITPEGTVGSTIAERAAKPGNDIYLSIDIDVQRATETLLGERVGSAVVMDPRDNSVLALASYPRFDPNAFIRGLTVAEFDSIIDDERKPLLHRPLLATYPPGSTFKVVTMAAGLEQGGFSTGSTIQCSPVWTGLGPDFPKNNWQTVDRGFLTPAEGLMASCNPVFYEMALELDHVDPDILPEFARAFGFGQPTGIDSLDEAPGVAPGPQWKEEALGEPWFSGDSVNMGIGQGFLAVTPLQITNMYSAIASDGVLRAPLLIQRTVVPGTSSAQEFTAAEINQLPISASTLEAIRHGLTLVTQSPGGTSYSVFTGANLDTAGKSGTAEDLAFGADHVFFVAYANRAAPSIVALVALEEGESGSREAGPIVRGILESYLNGVAVSAAP
jgi:penicillin-binding protein 2